MYVNQEDVFYYLTVMNEINPSGDAEGRGSGHHQGQCICSRKARRNRTAPKVQLLGSGTILRGRRSPRAVAGAGLRRGIRHLERDQFSTELRRDGLDCERWNMLHPEAKPRASHVEQCLAQGSGPCDSATDYIKSYADQSAASCPSVSRCWHGRFPRPLGHAQEAAPVLRGGPFLYCNRRAGRRWPMRERSARTW